MAEDRLVALDTAIHRIGEAWARGDAATTGSLLSPTYTHVDVFGEFFDRSSWLEYVERRVDRATNIGVRDVQKRIVGDVAIVTGIMEVSGTGALSTSDRKNSTLRFTQMWVWRQGLWLREAFQGTLHSDTTLS